MKIKLTELKKHLKQYDQKELIDLVVELYMANKDVQNILSSKFLGEEAIEPLFNKAQIMIKNEFFPDRGHGKLRLTEVKKEITAFKNATNDEKRTIELMLCTVELGVEYTSTYGYISDSYYSSLLKMFDQVAIECDGDELLYREFSSRIDKVLSLATDTVWGFEEAMFEIYYSIQWVHDEDEDEDE
jgi:hypothetical protein